MKLERINNIRNSNYESLGWIKCKPEIKRIKVLGKEFLYDPNIMELWQVHGENKSEKVIEGYPYKPYTEVFKEPENKHIVFQATYACNLKCRYCFVMNHYCVKENTMTHEEMVKTLEMFQPNGDHKMGFFGGEPLMNWEAIYKTIEWAKTKARKNGKIKVVEINGKKYERLNTVPHITSNGTLINNSIAEYCVENGITWIISIDGKEKIHNENRPYANQGGNPWKDTMRGLEILKAAYNKHGYRVPRVTLRATFDNKNSNILETTKFLNKLMYDGYADHVSVEPCSLGESCAAASRNERIESENMKEIRAKFWPQYVETAKWFLSEIREGRLPSIHHFEMPLKRLYDREVAFSECGAGKGYVSVGPGGKISACHREHMSFIGDSWNFDKINQAKWMDNRYFTHTKCNTCWRRNSCGGGCRCNSQLYGNDINDPSPTECTFRDMQTKIVIWLLSELTHDQRRLYSSEFRQKKMKAKQKRAIESRNANSSGPNPRKPKIEGCRMDCQHFCMYPEQVNSDTNKAAQPKACTDKDCKCKNKEDKEGKK